MNEMKLELQGIKTLGNYTEKEKEKYEFDKTRDFYNRILDMFHRFRIGNDLVSCEDKSLQLYKI